MGSRRRGLWFGLAAAATFGASTPLAKRLLNGIDAGLLAGLLYLGAFLSLAVTRGVVSTGVEARIRRTDAPRLALLVVTGGVLAPVAMLWGLDRVSAASGSLLLNLEGPFTLVVALVVFGEHLDRRSMLGAGVIFGGAAVLTTGGGVGRDTLAGVLLIGLACLLWAVDNNVTQSLTDRDPRAVVLVKTGVAAVVNVSVGIALLDDGLPSAGVVGGALLLGGVSYGLSTLLDAYALRELGAAREAAVFATAPFMGLALAIPVLGYRPTVVELLAAVVMAGGLVVLLREDHTHRHVHTEMEHDHLHVHDEHHRHAHGPGVDPHEPHSHTHRHEPLVHSHGHVSDAHHRHAHRRHD